MMGPPLDWDEYEGAEDAKNPRFGEHTWPPYWTNGSRIEKWLLGQLGATSDLTPRQAAKRMEEDIKFSPKAFVDILVESGILEAIDNQPDHNGEYHASYWIPEPTCNHTPVPYSISENGEVTRQCSTCGDWLPSIKVRMPAILPITGVA